MGHAVIRRIYRVSVLEKLVYRARFMKPCLETEQSPGCAEEPRAETHRSPPFSPYAVTGETPAESCVTGSSGNGPSVDYYL